ncbi:MAG TPA: HAD hydrolase family protein [Phycisphaerales bacterium]|nr:HAD hydrolase family protein [Phycisphaerales bacterium]
MSPASDIRLLVLDMDGVMTDGAIVYDDAGREIKAFYVRDGLAIKLWQRLGFACAIITGRGGGAAERRADELGVRVVRQGSVDKAADLRAVAAEVGIPLSQTAFMGDDWPDLAPMRICGYPMCPADAHADVAAVAAYRAGAPGGRGAVRDAVEHLLQAKDMLGRALRLYDTDHGT